MLDLPGAPIDRDSPLPFYFQLARLFEEEIVGGRWTAGAQLPSEPAIGEHYGLSRTTVRQALARLENEGLILREKGHGTFVAGARSRSWLLQSTEGFFHEEVARRGLQVTSRVLSAKVGRLPGWAQEALALAPGSDGVSLERLRSIEGRIALYVLNYLPVRFADTVLGLEGSTVSLYEELERRDRISVAGGHRSLEAVKADRKLGRMLEVGPGAPLAFIESVSWDAGRRPFDCYRTWLRTDRIRIEVEVNGPEQAQPSRRPRRRRA